MYAADDNKYCYRGTTILRNKAELRSQAQLVTFEAVMTAERYAEPLPRGKLGFSHYRSIHRHIFQDVYSWAGKYRSVRIGKNESAFCYPEYIPSQMATLFARLKGDRFLVELPADAFAVGRRSSWRH